MESPEPTAGTAQGGSRLLKVLGVAFGLAIIVGNTIGVGILRSPGDVAAALPRSGWFIGAWVAGGIYALLRRDDDGRARRDDPEIGRAVRVRAARAR